MHLSQCRLDMSLLFELLSIIMNKRSLYCFRLRRDALMDNMFKLCGFWTGIFAVMFFVGDMMTASVIFVASTIFFLLLGYLNLTERMYMYMFGAYLMIFMVGLSYYATVIHVRGAGRYCSYRINSHSGRFFLCGSLDI